MNNDLETDLEQQLSAIRSHKNGKKKLRAYQLKTPGSPEKIRAQLGLSQTAFAALLNISVKTLQNWEQGQRQPQGPALALLRIIEQYPEVLLNRP
ncbi:MAG: helix-turn-helix domain-containing protein [Gammaproteobacteria bacterium]|jgi:putative transcriptional regulator